MAHQLFEVGQKAFIERDGQVLILFFPNGFFDFPGGRIDEGESDVIAALLREVQEETTLEIEVGDPFATWMGNRDLLGREQSIYLVGYRCRYVSGEVQLSDEHVAFRWVDASTYQQLDDGSGAFGALKRHFARSLDQEFQGTRAL